MAKSTKKYIAAGGLAAAAVAGYVLTREKVEALDPANIMLSNPIAEPQIVFPGHVVTISVEATNIGETRGSHTIILSIPIGELDIEQSKTVVLDPTETKDVVFTISAPEAGTYVAYMNGEQASFIVESSGEPPQYVYICPECGEEFATQGELDMHMATVHGEPPPTDAIYIPGTLDWNLNWSADYGDFTFPKRDWELVVTNNSDIDQIFDVQMGFKYSDFKSESFIGWDWWYRNNFIAAHDTIVIDSGTWSGNNSWGIDDSYTKWMCQLGGPTSDLTNLSGSWSEQTLVWQPTGVAYNAVVAKIRNLTDQWQSVKVLDTFYALEPGQTISFEGQLYDIRVNDRLWLGIEQLAGSVVNVEEYDIWY